MDCEIDLEEIEALALEAGVETGDAHLEAWLYGLTAARKQLLRPKHRVDWSKDGF